MTFYHSVCNCAHNSFRHLDAQWCSLCSYTETPLTTMTMSLWRLDILRWKCHGLAYVNTNSLVIKLTQSEQHSFSILFLWYSMAPQYNVTMNILFIFSSLVHSFACSFRPLTNKAQMKLFKRSIFRRYFQCDSKRKCAKSLFSKIQWQWQPSLIK